MVCHSSTHTHDFSPSWFIFSLIIQPKLLSFLPTNQIQNKPLTTTKAQPWTWPWT